MEHLHVTTSDIRMHVVVIYNLNLSLQFCNDKLYTLPRVFTLVYASMSPEFLHRFVFGLGYSSLDSKTASKDKNQVKYSKNSNSHFTIDY